MGTWRKVCTGLSAIILVMVLYLSLFGSPLTAHYLESQVVQYLVETGITEENILSAKAVYQRDKQTSYVVQVVFADEPEIVHYYYSNVDKEIQEMEHVSQ
ncbi:MAG: DUF3139 domain-containing protein [Peptococcaceae bacterium]|mgnify:CR=1 FL=1|nr:DUF3139 domain-containing protein [Peptococcaceae bacterium]MBQ2994171.1 DUF3139 domain-containing protein [Peptococcaceae bacterium]